MKSRLGILTGDADVSFAALGGPRRAPSHTLTPEVLGPEQLLHLLTGDLYTGFSHHQACKDRRKTTEQRRRNQARMRHPRRSPAWERSSRSSRITGFDAA